MTEEVRALAIRSGMDEGQPADMLMRDARVWGRARAQMKRCLARITRGQAQEALTLASRIDRVVKGIAGGDVGTIPQAGADAGHPGKGRARLKARLPSTGRHPRFERVQQRFPGTLGICQDIGAPDAFSCARHSPRQSSATTTRPTPRPCRSPSQ